MKAKEIAVVAGRVKPRTNLSAEWAMRYIDDSRVDPTLSQVNYGVLWALGTGRLAGAADMAIRALSAYRYCMLLADAMRDGCRVANDLPRWLNAREF